MSAQQLQKSSFLRSLPLLLIAGALLILGVTIDGGSAWTILIRVLAALLFVAFLVSVIVGSRRSVPVGHVD